MDKIERVKEHLTRHPSDYQSVVSLYKLQSKEIEKRRWDRKTERLRKIAECRRALNEQKHSV